MTTWTLQDFTPPNWEPPRKALTDEEIDLIALKLNVPYDILKIARAIELAHGIVQESSNPTKEKTSEDR